MSEKAQRFSNRKANKVAGQSTHVPKQKFETERQEKADVVHETFIEEVPKPEPEPTMDEALPKEEQALLQAKTTPIKRGRK